MTAGPRTLRLIAVTGKPHSASFEQRIVRFVEPLRERGIEVETRVLPPGRRDRLRLVDALGDADGVWWHRNLPPPWWPGRIRRRARRLVLDFDDPLSWSSRRGGRWSITRTVRFAAMLRRCDAAFAGSGFLADLARRHVARVEVVPMAIDVPPEAPAHPAGDGAVELLWLGSASTQPYLEIARPALERLGADGGTARLRLVAHAPMSFGRLPVDLVPWSPAAQAAALAECAVGLCPMPDSPWTRGKCPYKVLQYMAAGMPWVGSAVGENVATAGTGDDARGLVAADADAWLDALRRLVADAGMRASFGRRGHAYVLARHDRAALADRLAALWRSIAG